MHLTDVSLSNWKCFRGRQSVALKPVTYGIFARAEEDETRSNWLGKSSFIQAVRFALYGDHEESTEDSWISRGEKSGEVSVTFSTGERIVRSRQLGKSTKLFLFSPNAKGTPDQLMGDEAQDAIVRIVGLSSVDFGATCYFEQKKMSQLVTMRAKDRADIVSEWLRLERVKQAESNAVQRLREHLSSKEKIDRAGESQRAVIDAAFAGIRADLAPLDQALPPVESNEQDRKQKTELLIRAIDVARVEMAKSKSELADLETRRSEVARYQSLKKDSARYDALLVEGKAIDATIKERDEPRLARVVVEASSFSLSASITSAEHDKILHRLRVLKTQGFDGKCPVVDGVECPAKTEINERASKNGSDVADAASAGEKSRQVSASALKRLRDVQAELQAVQRMRAQLAAIKSQMEPLLSSRKELRKLQDPGDEEGLRAEHERTTAECARRTTLEHRLSGALATIRRAQESLAALTGEYGSLVEQIATCREAVVVLGRQGAQKTIAEGALNEIEEESNDSLRSAGIPLTVQARWSREGSGIAATCETCGSPFGRSAREKNCLRCGAARGANVVHGLDLVLSDYSGAAEDLAGGFFQLSASAWLRNDRMSSWGVALLDEPFGSLDASNRKALSAHLRALLTGRYGFEQALVIAHHGSVLDALQGRIQITSTPEGSRVEVIS